MVYNLGVRRALAYEVNLKSISDINKYIKFKTLKYKYFKLKNNNL